MMKKNIVLIFLFFPFFSLARSGDRSEVIYGYDDRKEVHEVLDPKWQEVMRGVAIQIPAQNFATNSNGKIVLQGPTLKENHQLCIEERFIEQVSVGNCTGFLVGADLLITAGHCIPSADDCLRNRWVFGYGQEHPHQGNSIIIEQEQIYQCQEIVAQEWKGSRDYALIRLEREVTDRLPLKLRTEGGVKQEDPLVMIGHPDGIAMKWVDHARVLNSSHADYFEADLDAFHVNSGSPVLNSEGVVEGILVRGQSDYIFDAQNLCQRVHKIPDPCSEGLCQGEGVTRIGMVLEFLQ